MDKKFNAEDFMLDLGLDFNVQMLPRPEEKPSNLIKMKHADIVGPIPAIQFHVDNLIATYGENTVKEALDDLYKAIGWKD